MHPLRGTEQEWAEGECSLVWVLEFTRTFAVLQFQHQDHNESLCRSLERYCLDLSSCWWTIKTRLIVLRSRTFLSFLHKLPDPLCHSSGNNSALESLGLHVKIQVAVILNYDLLLKVLVWVIKKTSKSTLAMLCSLNRSCLLRKRTTFQHFANTLEMLFCSC